MKRISKKLTTVLLIFLSLLLVLGGVFALRAPANADEAPGDSVATEEHVYGGGDHWFTLRYKESTSHLTLLLDASYRDYLNASMGDFREIYDVVKGVLEQLVIDGIFGTVPQEPEAQPAAQTVSYIAAPTAIDPTAFDPSAFDPNEFKGNLSGLTMEDVNKYLDNLTFQQVQDYAQGKYDVLVQLAAETYLNGSEGDTTQKLEDLKEEMTKRLETTIKEKIEEGKGDWAGVTEAEKEQLVQDVLDKTEESIQKVEENDGKASISAADVLSLLRKVTVNGRYTIYSDATVVLSGIKQMLTELPRPSEIADMSDEEIASLIEYRFDVDTDYGDFGFTVTFGFSGDCSKIRTAARLIDDHLDVSRSSDGTFHVTARMPVLFSELYRSALASTQLTDAQKTAFFSLFTTPVEDIVYRDDLFDTALDTLKGVDYQHFFTNFLSAEWLNGFVGEYFTLTDEKIDNFIDRFVGLVNRAANVDIKEVEDLLKNHVSGSTRLKNAVEKLYNFINKFNWAEIDAKTIRDRIARGDFNDTVYSYIDKLENYEDLYDRLLDYVRKAFEYLPENVQSKTLVELYRGSGVLTASGSKTLDVVSLLRRGINFLDRHGINFFDGLDSKIDQILGTQSKVYTLSIDAELDVPDVYGVQYEVDGEVVREGLLPVGADVKFFSDTPDVEGYDVLYWFEAEDLEHAEVATMPAKDIVLRPRTEFEINGFVGEDEGYELQATYDLDGNGYDISVKVDGVSYAEYTYQWYQKVDGEEVPVDGKTEDTLNLHHISENGTYFVRVTDIGTGYEKASKDFVVKISPLEVTLDATLLDKDTEPYADPYTYSAEKQYVEWSYTYSDKEGTYDTDRLKDFFGPDDKPADGVLEAEDAGTYIAKLDACTKDLAELTDGDVVLTCKLNGNPVEGDTVSAEWVIEKATVTAEIVWQKELSFVYDGETHKVEATVTPACDTVKEELLPGDLLTVTYIDDNGHAHEGKNAGKYNALIEVTLNAAYANNYELEAPDAADLTKAWEIKQAVVSLNGTLTWAVTDSEEKNVDTDDYKIKYNPDLTYTLSVSNAEIVFRLNDKAFDDGIFASVIACDTTAEGNSASNVGTYTAKYIYSLVDPDNYMFDAGIELEGGKYVAEQAWEIVALKITINVDAIDIDPTPTTFVEEDGKTYTPAIVEDSLIDAITCDGNKFDTVDELKEVVKWVVDGDQNKSAAGTYTTTFAFEVKNTNYVIVSDPVKKTVNWTITHGAIDLSDAGWTVDGNIIEKKDEGFAYSANYKEDGGTFAVSLNNVGEFDPSNFTLKITKNGEVVDSIKDAGIYEVEAIGYDDGKGDVRKIKNSPMLTVTVNQIEIDVSEVHLYKNSFEFRNEEISVDVAGLPLGVVRTLGGQVTGTDVGSYTVIVYYSLADTYATNYKLSAESAEFTWKIEKKIFDLSGVKLVKESFDVLAGDEIEVEVNAGTIPDGLSIKSYGGDKKSSAVGQHTVTVTFTWEGVDTKNYGFKLGSEDNNGTVELTWTIYNDLHILISINWDKIVISPTTWVKDGDAHQPDITSDLRLAITYNNQKFTTLEALQNVVWYTRSGDPATDIGEYETTFRFTLKDSARYAFDEDSISSKTVKWSITAPEADLSEATWDVNKEAASKTDNGFLANLTYDGTDFVVALKTEGLTLPADFKAENLRYTVKKSNVEADVNSRHDAGTYTVEVSYEGSDVTLANAPKLTVIIAKATIRVVDVALNADSFVFSNTQKTVDVNPSTLPEGVTYVIVESDDSTKTATEVGEYTVTVNFSLDADHEANYQLLTESRTFTWNITELSIELGGIELKQAAFDYEVGVDHTVEINEETLPVSGLKFEYIDGQTAEEAGPHIVTVKISWPDVDSKNYSFKLYGKDSDGTITLNWHVDDNRPQITIDLNALRFTGTSFEADGDTHGPELDTSNLLEAITCSEPFTTLEALLKVVTWEKGGEYEESAIGKYSATFTFSVTDDSYVIVGNNKKTVEWEITEPVIDLTGASWTVNGKEVSPKAEVVYSGEEFVVSLTNIGDFKLEDFTFEIKKVDSVVETIVDAGEYIVALVKYKGSSEVKFVGLTDLTLTVNPQTVNVGETSLKNKTFEFDNTEKTITADDVINVPAEAEVVSVSCDPKKDVGTYEVTVTFKLATGYDNGNYVLSDDSWTIQWEITPKIFVLDDVHLVQSVFYIGTESEFEVEVDSGSLTDTLKAELSGDVSATKAGVYHVIVTYTWEGGVDAKNYAFTLGGVSHNNKLTLEWNVFDEYVDMSIFELDHTTFTYNGEEHTVDLKAYSLDETKYHVEVTGDKVGTNAGTYKVVVTVTATSPDSHVHFLGSDAEKDGQKTLTWTIEKAPIEIGDNVALKDSTFVYNGTVQKVEVNPDTLPAGVKVAYAADSDYSGTDVDTYTVKVYFICDENHTISGDATKTFTWTITKAEVSLDGVKLSQTKFDEDGTDKTVTLVDVPEGVTYEVSDDSTLTEKAAGNYTVTVTFTADENYAITGEATKTLHWTIASKTVTETGDVLIEKKPGNTFDPEKHTANRNPVQSLSDAQKEAIGDAVEGKFGEGSSFNPGKAWDINFTDEEGNELEDLGSFVIRLLIPEELREGNRNLAVIHIKDDGSVEFVDAEREGNYMVFEASDFSVYSVIEITEPEKPDEGNLWWVWLLVAIIVLLLILIIVLLVILLKKKKNAPEDPAADDEVTDEVPYDGEEDIYEEPTEDESVTAEPAEVPEEDYAETPVYTAPVYAPVYVPAPVPAPEPEPEPEEEPAPPAVPQTYYFPAGFDDKELTKMLDKSFTARITQADDEVKEMYSVLKNEILSYKGVKSRVSWGYDTFNKGRNKCVRLQMKGKTLRMYIALDPTTLSASKYHHKDVSEIGKYAEYPTLLKIKSKRSLKYAKELIEILMDLLEVEKGENANISYVMPYQSTEVLLGLGLIRWKQAVLPEFWGAPTGEAAVSDDTDED